MLYSWHNHISKLNIIERWRKHTITKAIRRQFIMMLLCMTCCCCLFERKTTQVPKIFIHSIDHWTFSASNNSFGKSRTRKWEKNQWEMICTQWDRRNVFANFALPHRFQLTIFGSLKTDFSDRKMFAWEIKERVKKKKLNKVETETRTLKRCKLFQHNNWDFSLINNKFMLTFIISWRFNLRIKFKLLKKSKNSVN